MKKIAIQVFSEGISLGKTKWIKRKHYNITRHTISEDEIQEELQKFEKIIDKVVEEIDSLLENSGHSQENHDILSTHKMILKDPELAIHVKKMVKHDLLSLEKALEKHFQQIISLFENMDNDYLAQRSIDYEDVAHRLLDSILDSTKQDEKDVNENTVIVAESVRPSEVTKWFSKKIQGICVEKGSKNCHAAIIARSMSIPYVAGVPQIFDTIEEGQEIIIDGAKKVVIIKPDAETKANYRKTIEKEENKSKKLHEITDLPTETKDGKKIQLMCNMEIPEELEAVQLVQSDGIGLFRTEFLFMERADLPDEDEQYEIYKKIAEAVHPSPFIIRTIDVGGDKLADSIQRKKENNPALGMRGIRISLANQELFLKQIRAIIRANEHGNIKIMFPMISCVDELRQAKKTVNQCLEDLLKKGIKRTIEIGTMIEVPSAALNAEFLAKECDFFSIGTNDLTQYTLAVDRDNEKVAKYYNPSNLAVIKLIKHTTESAKKENIPVAVCGEMASQPDLIELLIGLGIEELSVSPGAFLLVKEKILNINAEECIKNTKNKIENASIDVIT
jgi:phosphotransferase system enzyme I (PtsI)